MRQLSRMMQTKIHPTIGWRRDEHGTHKHAHGSCMDSLICITCSLENNAFSVLHYVMVALHYSVLHRFEIFSAPGTIALGSIRLPPRSLASSRGCSLAIIINKRYNRLIIRCPEQMQSLLFELHTICKTYLSYRHLTISLALHRAGGVRGIWQGLSTVSQKRQMPGGFPGGMMKFRIDQRIKLNSTGL